MRTNIRTFSSKPWLALSFCLVSFLAQDASAAGNSDSLLIRNIYLNQEKQLVVEFDNPAHINPVAPQVLDYPGDKHDIILEFSNTSFAVGKVPRAKTVLDELTKSFSNISSIAYAASNDATKARIKLSVSKEVTTHPALAKVDQNSAIINLDLPARTSNDTNKGQPTNPAPSEAGLPAGASPNALASAQSSAAIPSAVKAPSAVSDNAAVSTPKTSSIASDNAAVSALKTTSTALDNAAASALTAASSTAPDNPTASPENIPTAGSNTESVTSSSASSPENSTAAAPVTTSATTSPAAPAATPAAQTGLMHGLKGVWQSTSSNVGKFAKLPKLFGGNKVDNTSENTDTKQAAAASLPSATGDDTAGSAATTTASMAETAGKTPVTPIAAGSTAEAAGQTPATPIAAGSTAEAAGQVPAIPIATASTPTSSTPFSQPQGENTPGADTSNAAPADKAAIKSVAENLDKVVGTEDVPSIPTKTAETPANKIEQSTASTTAEASSAIEDKKLLDLPRIALAPKETTNTTVNKDQLTPPLSADDVSPLQKQDTVAANLPASGSVLTSKTVTNDASVASDLKTDLSAASGKESKQPATEEQPTSTTGGESANLPASGSKKVVKNVELKAMTAHSGGKDYYPPSVTTEGQEAGYSDDTLKHYNEAVRFHIAGKLPEAIAEYHAAIAGNPRMEEAHSNLGLIFNQQNKYEQAISEFHKALAINPKDAITYNGIGAAMRAQKNMIAAIKNWQTAISLDPNLASAHYNLGTAYEIDRDLEKALAEYKLAVKYDQKLGEAYYHMGLILQKMNNRSLALEQFKQAVKLSAQADYSQDAKHRVDLLSQKKDAGNM